MENVRSHLNSVNSLKTRKNFREAARYGLHKIQFIQTQLVALLKKDRRHHNLQIRWRLRRQQKAGKECGECHDVCTSHVQTYLRRSVGLDEPANSCVLGNIVSGVFARVLAEHGVDCVGTHDKPGSCMRGPTHSPMLTRSRMATST